MANFPNRCQHIKVNGGLTHSCFPQLWIATKEAAPPRRAFRQVGTTEDGIKICSRGLILHAGFTRPVARMDGK